MTSEFSVLGKSVARKDALEKVKGEAKYVSDIQLAKMLHAKFLRSPHAHARITSIDTSKAEKIPGVKCILSHQNVPKVHPLRRFEYLLDDTVHYPGEEVAAVAALTPEIAEEALKVIEVEYIVLPAIIDMEEAMKPLAPLAHQEYFTNIYHGTELVKIPRLGEDGWLRLEVGDIDKGFAEADYIIDGTYETPMQYNCSPMPRAVVCDWVGEKLTCWADTQMPLLIWQDLANNLNIPMSNIRVIASHAVGGYGGKQPEKTATLVAIMAKRAGRPVKMVFSRAEDFVGTHHRISFKSYHKCGVKKDGTITAIYSKIIANLGSDSSAPGVCQANALLNTCTMPYKWQNSKAETCGVLTNIRGHGAMHGFGGPEGSYTIERLIDETAEQIDMDPLEFRYKNCVRSGDKAMEYEQVLYGPVEWGILGPDMDSLPEMIRICAEVAQWKEKWRGWRMPVAANGPRRTGIGIAIGLNHAAFWPCSAIIKMNQDGTANVLSGAVEMGQGYATAIAQVVAETLGIRYEDVNPVLADTLVTPAAIGNIASTGTTSALNAAELAANDAKRRLLELAAPRLNASVADLKVRDRKIWVKGTDNSISIAEICSSNWQITGTANNPPYHTIKDEKTGKVIHTYCAGVTIAEVEVDIETGMIEVVKITTAHDSGRTINPVLVENQIDLGLTMAKGWVCTEKYIVDSKTGIVVNPNLLDYKLITFLDMPRSNDIKRIIVEKPSATGPFGAKGMTQTTMTGLPAAIANAIYNAIGVRIYSGHLSPDNVLMAIKSVNRE